MLKKIQQFLESTFQEDHATEDNRERAIHLATAGLMVEVMRSDFDMADVERDTIRRLVTHEFGLSETDANDILNTAEQTHESASSLYPMVQTLINALSIEQRAGIVEHMWRVAFADGQLDKYEEACIRKVADLLYVPHPLFIQARHKAEHKSECD